MSDPIDTAGLDATPPREADQWCSDALDGQTVGDAPSDATAERQRAFAHAKSLLADVAPLDEVTRARLVRAALDSVASNAEVQNVDDHLAPRRSRSARWLAPVGAVAAAAAAVVGVFVFQDSGPSSDVADDRVASEAATADVAVQLEELPYLGDVSDPAVVRDLVGGDSAAELGSNAEYDVASSTLPPADDGTSDVDRTSFSEDSPVESATGSITPSALPDNCLTALNPGGVRPALIGTGDFRGESVVVAIAEEPGRTIVFVVGNGCSTLHVQQIATG
jgi:hypothetical protein